MRIKTRYLSNPPLRVNLEFVSINYQAALISYGPPALLLFIILKVFMDLSPPSLPRLVILSRRSINPAVIFPSNSCASFSSLEVALLFVFVISQNCGTLALNFRALYFLEASSST